jgi:hypothetical protein
MLCKSKLVSGLEDGGASKDSGCAGEALFCFAVDAGTEGLDVKSLDRSSVPECAIWRGKSRLGLRVFEGAAEECRSILLEASQGTGKKRSDGRVYECRSARGCSNDGVLEEQSKLKKRKSGA